MSKLSSWIIRLFLLVTAAISIAATQYADFVSIDDLGVSDGQWVVLGNEVIASVPGYYGSSQTAISDDGKTFAVTEPYASGPNGEKLVGMTRIFQMVDGDWSQIGDNIYGSAEYQLMERPVLSKDGTRLAVGSHKGGVEGPIESVQVYMLLGDQWAAGPVIQSEANWNPVYNYEFDVFGSVLAVTFQQSVRVYELGRFTSSQLGQDLVFNPFGIHISSAIDSFGDSIAVGGLDSGLLGGVAVYDLNYSTLTWEPRSDLIPPKEFNEAFLDFELVDLSADGNHLIVNQPFYSYRGSDAAYDEVTGVYGDAIERAGLLRALDWTGSEWVQNRDSVIGSEKYCLSTSLGDAANADASITLVKPCGGLPSGENVTDEVRALHWNGREWIQLGQRVQAVLENVPTWIGGISADGKRITLSQHLSYRDILNYNQQALEDTLTASVYDFDDLQRPPYQPEITGFQKDNNSITLTVRVQTDNYHAVDYFLAECSSKTKTSTESTLTVQGLENGREHTCFVRAVNAEGNSEISETITINLSDRDGDDYIDERDEFPDDPSEWRDRDRDGVGDNADWAPDDPSESSDSDGDGVGDNADDLPFNPQEAVDSDEDGVGDNSDNCIEIANPEQLNTDNDSLGNACDRDDDDDGIPDDQDKYSLVPIGGLTDTDRDGAPDECDPECLATGMRADTDDDDDGVDDINDAFPLVALNGLTDTDGDGEPNDCAELEPSPCEGTPMVSDKDDDNDGYSDIDELTDRQSDPLDATSLPLDTDGDLISDATDVDDDNDGIPDDQDAYPLVAIGNLTDTDGDGAPDDCAELTPSPCDGTAMVSDSDDDNDGVADDEDAFPLDANKDTDTDSDGLGDNGDNCPSLSNQDQLDTDNDSQGDLCDADDDNDGLTDAEESDIGTDPLKRDSDGDGWSDKEEVDEGTDPLDPNNAPELLQSNLLLLIPTLCEQGKIAC